MAADEFGRDWRSNRIENRVSDPLVEDPSCPLLRQ
jgi:hypothetical protein